MQNGDYSKNRHYTHIMAFSTNRRNANTQCEASLRASLKDLLLTPMETEMVKVTREFIDKGKTANHGWCAAQLRIIGVSWPPKKGWKDATAAKGKEISVEDADMFIGYAQGRYTRDDVRQYNRVSKWQ